MLGAMLGSVIISMATVSLVIAIQVGNHALDNAGRSQATPFERDIIRASGRNPKDFKSNLIDDFDSLLRK